MNIFQNRDMFFGKSNFINIHSHVSEFWKLAKEIKAKLGNQKYYLDGYVNIIFETLADMDLGTASAIADNICSNVLGDCYVITGENEREEKEKSKFFDMVQKYIEEHPREFQREPHKIGILCCKYDNRQSGTAISRIQKTL